MSEKKIIKISTGFFDDSRIKYLRTQKHGDEIVLMWIMILTQAARLGRDGTIRFEDGVSKYVDYLSDEIGLDRRSVADALNWFDILEMIKLSKDEIEIVSWDKYAFSANDDSGRESNYYRFWRNYIFERDNYTCQRCGDTRENGAVLNAHHVLSWKNHVDKRFDVENGITLCEECHRKYHKEHGYAKD